MSTIERAINYSETAKSEKVLGEAWARGEWYMSEVKLECEVRSLDFEVVKSWRKVELSIIRSEK